MSKDIDAILQIVGLSRSPTDYSEKTRDESNGIIHEDLITKLMHFIVQCMGTLRAIVQEQEQERLNRNCCDIDGTTFENGRKALLQREIFAIAMKKILESLVSGERLDNSNPLKDLMESIPWHQSTTDSLFYMLNWVILDGFHLSCKNLHENKSNKIGPSIPSSGKQEVETNDDSQSETKSKAEEKSADTDNFYEEFYMRRVARVLDFYPDSIKEIDKKGQHFLSYVIRTNSVPLLEYFIASNRNCVRYKDGTGKQAVHYVAKYSQSVEMLYLVCDAMGKPMKQVLTECVDDDGNLPIHIAAASESTSDLLKEMVFTNLETVRVPNKDGRLPLHFAATNTSVEKVKSLLGAFPNAVMTQDKNGWLPMHHAAYASKSVAVVRMVHEAYPEAISKPHYSGRVALHYAAVTCPSVETMAYLLNRYPQGAKTFDLNRRLPLHNIIARCASMEPVRLACLRLLLRIYPLGAGMRGSDDRTPLDLARRDHHGDLVQLLLLQADPTQDPEALEELVSRVDEDRVDRYT